jgi:hypothetical protein
LNAVAPDLRQEADSNDTEGSASPDDPEATNGLHGLPDAVQHDFVGDLPALGHQFVLKLSRIRPRQMNLLRMPTRFAKPVGGSGDAFSQGHGCIVPIVAAS